MRIPPAAKPFRQCPWLEIYLSLLIFLHNVLLPFFLSTSLCVSFFYSPFPEHFDVLSEYSYMK